MTEFKIGDKVKRIKAPTDKMPLYSEWKINYISPDRRLLRFVNDPYPNLGGWDKTKFQLLVDTPKENVKRFIVIESEIDPILIAGFLKTKEVEARVSRDTDMLPAGPQWIPWAYSVEKSEMIVKPL